MKSKKKMILSIILLLAVIGVIVSSIIIVYGVSKQSLDADFSITYNIEKDTYATVTVNVYSNGELTQNSTFSFAGEKTSGSFNDINGVSIDPNKEDLTASIEIAITNNQPNETNGGSPDLYVTHVANVENSLNIAHTRWVSFNDKLNYEEFDESSVKITQNQTVYIKLLFEVEDIFEYAEVNGGINLNFVHVAFISQLPKSFLTQTLTQMGEYPQQYVGNRLNNMIKLNYENMYQLSATGKTYNVGVYELVEYTCNGYKIAQLTYSNTYTDNNVDNYTFSTGDVIVDNATYYFYVQPIKVILMDVGSGNYGTYMSKNTLFSFEYSLINGSSWTTSDIRSYLNSTFANNCGIQATSVEIIDENYAGSGDILDKFWLPSETEIIKWYPTESARKKKPTDVALATYTYYYKEYDAGYYWTRTASDSSTVVTVHDTGNMGAHDSTSSGYGVSVCFVAG